MTRDLIKRCQEELASQHEQQDEFMQALFAHAQRAYEDSQAKPGTVTARKPRSVDWIQMKSVWG